MLSLVGLKTIRYYHRKFHRCLAIFQPVKADWLETIACVVYSFFLQKFIMQKGPI